MSLLSSEILNVVIFLLKSLRVLPGALSMRCLLSVLEILFGIRKSFHHSIPSIIYGHVYHKLYDQIGLREFSAALSMHIRGI